MPPKRRDAAATRTAILGAAREVFGRDGYERTTIRAVASAAGIDPALVMRYFGSKEGLFAQAVDLRIDLPDLRGLTPEQMTDAIVTRFFELWEDDPTFVALLRASATSEAVADRLRTTFAAEVGPTLAAAAIDHPMERAAMAGTQVIGFAYMRYVVGVPTLRAMDREAVRRWLGSSIVRHLTAPV